MTSILCCFLSLGRIYLCANQNSCSPAHSGRTLRLASSSGSKVAVSWAYALSTAVSTAADLIGRSQAKAMV